MLLTSLGLTLTYWRLERPRSDELVRLPALLVLLRCILDPFTQSYHHVPFLVTLLGYETLARRRIPVLTLYSAAALYAMGRWVAPTATAATFNKVYLACALPLAAYLAYKTFLPRTQRSATVADPASLNRLAVAREST